MVKDNLETRVKKSVIKIEKSVAGIYNMLTDLSLKLCHTISRLGDYHKGTYKDSYFDGL